MPRAILNLLLLPVLLSAQGGLDFLNQSQNAVSAALGLNMAPLQQPHVLARPERVSVASLGMWSWVSDVGGVELVAEAGHTAFGLRANTVGNVQIRKDYPSVEPQGSFEYSLITTSAAYGRALGKLELGLGTELIRERSLSASAWGMALSVSAAYPLLEGWQSAAGARNLGGMGKLENESSDVPAEFWLRLSRELAGFTVSSELNSGPAPLHLALQYELTRTILLLGGIQIEPAAETSLRPSTGLVVNRQQFSLGFALSDLSHPLGMQQHYTLYWYF